MIHIPLYMALHSIALRMYVQCSPLLESWLTAFVEAVPESFRAASRGYQSSYPFFHETFCLDSTFSANDSVEAGIHGHASPEKGAKVILLEKTYSSPGIANLTNSSLPGRTLAFVARCIGPHWRWTCARIPKVLNLEGNSVGAMDK